MSEEPNARTEPRPTFRRSLGDGWNLALPFWRSRDEWRSRLLLALVVVLTLSTVGLNVLFSNWNNRFYNTLQDHDLAGFWRQLGVFCILAAAFIVVAVYRQYLQQQLFMRWRTWVTHNLLDGWLQPGTAYRLGTRIEHRIDNPDQRIAEDARGFVASSLDLTLGLLNAMVTMVSFVTILWGLSGVLVVPIGAGLPVSGYMVWVAVGYALLGTWITHRLGRPLFGLNGEQQKVEADFRYALVQVRDNAEAIAFARGERREWSGLATGFEAVRGNWSALIRTTKRLTWFSAGYGQLANVFPVLAAAPRYFAGALQLGGLMQTAQAFGQVQGSLSWFIDAYPRLADWRATVNRLTLFVSATRADSASTSGIAHVQHARAAVVISDLSVVAADGRVLVNVDSRHIESGSRLLISGPSGSGKSTVMRAIAGLYRDGRGLIRTPSHASLMFVSQRPYLPDGTLREALAYPLCPDAFAVATMERAIERAGLSGYANQIDTRRRWSRVLSPGEQQCIHFARAMLHRPDWVFLDESTSALDEAAEQALCRELTRSLPMTTVVSVGHRSTLARLHDEFWTIESTLRQHPTPAVSFGPIEAAQIH